MKSYKISKSFAVEEEVVDGTQSLNECAKIKIIRAGICASDIAIFAGRMDCVNLPIVPCRVAVGLVSESEDITLRKGQRVLLSPYTRFDNGSYTINGIKSNGYLGDYVYAHLQNIYTIPDHIKDCDLTFVEDIAMACNVIEKLDIDKTKYVMLFGCSAVNLIIAQLCIYYQAIPIIIDNDNSRLNIAQDLGVYYCINYAEEEVLQKIKEITSGKLVDYLILDSDICEEVGRMLHYVRKDGKVAIVGYNTAIPSLKGDFSAIVKNNLTVYGINDGFGEFHTAINMLATEIVKVNKLIDEVVDLENVQPVFANLAKQKYYFKTIIKC